MRFSASFKLEFLKRFLLLASGLVVVGTVFFLLQTERHESAKRAEAESLVAVERRILLDAIDRTSSDVRFLSSLFEQRASALDAPPDSDSELVRLLIAFMISRPHYFQVRYIDSTGQEILRLEQHDNPPHLVPPAELQNKSSREYFQKTMQLLPTQTYVSPFNLNVERSVVERPFRPTLRVATQVQQGDKRPGIAVINLDGTKLIELLRSVRHSSGLQVFMVNDKGHWLVGPRRGLEWGNSLPDRQRYTLAARQPELWSRILSAPSGSFQNSSGFYAYAKAALDPSGEIGAAITSSEHWTLLAYFPQEFLKPEWRFQFLTLGLVVLCFLAAVSALLTRSVLHRQRAEQSLQESQEQIQAISHSSHDALIMVDERGRIAFWNPAAEAMLGYRSKDVLGLPAAGFLISPSCTDPLSGPALKSGPFSETNCKKPLLLARKDGGTFPAEVALSSFQLHGSWWTVNAVRDITKRINALAELDKSREMLVEAQSISRLGGFSFAVDSEEISWTDEMRSLHGVDRNFVPTVQAMAKFVDEKHRNAFLDAVASSRKGNPVELEIPLITAKGRRIWVRVSIRAHFAGDKVSRLSGIYQDVTDRKLERMRTEQLSTAVEHSPASVLITNSEGIVEYVNPKFTEVCGYPSDRIIGNDTVLLDPENSEPALSEILRLAAETGSHWSGEICTRILDGTRIWQQLSISPIRDEEGSVRHFVGVMEDITERRRSREALQASERRIRAMSEATLDAMVVIDSNARISFWNPAATRFFGYTEQEALGQDIHALIGIPKESAGADDSMRHFSETGAGTVIGNTRELTARRKDGSLFPCEITVSSFSLDTCWYAVGTIRDITRRKEYERRLRSLATTDELTGLLNRRALLELAENELDRSRRYNRPFCLIMLDLDRFKNINDTYGHAAGDKVLKAVSQTGVEALRETDTLGRIGGEEFAAILPETNAKQAMDVAERLRKSVARILVGEPSAPNGAINVTISAGIAEFLPDRNTVELILKAADTALYRAKEQGRNRTEIA